jgi:ABC-type oligopeptide transport system substrate-binding subunit
VKLKDVKVDGKEKVVKEVKANDIVKTVMRAWDDVVESPTKYSYASAVMRFKDVVKKFQSLLTMLEMPFWKLSTKK